MWSFAAAARRRSELAGGMDSGAEDSKRMNRAQRGEHGHGIELVLLGVAICGIRGVHGHLCEDRARRRGFRSRDADSYVVILAVLLDRRGVAMYC